MIAGAPCSRIMCIEGSATDAANQRVGGKHEIQLTGRRFLSAAMNWIIRWPFGSVERLAIADLLILVFRRYRRDLDPQKREQQINRVQGEPLPGQLDADDVLEHDVGDS